MEQITKRQLNERIQKEIEKQLNEGEALIDVVFDALNKIKEFKSLSMDKKSEISLVVKKMIEE